MDLGPSPLLHREKKNWQEDVDDLVGDEQSAEHRRRHRPDDFSPHAGGPEHGGDRDDRGPLGEQLGTEPVDRPFEDRLTENGNRSDVSQSTLFLDGLAEVDQHHDAGLYGHAEAGDVANPYRDAEVEPEEPLED